MEGADFLYFKMPKIHFFKERKGATQLHKTDHNCYFLWRGEEEW